MLKFKKIAAVAATATVLFSGAVVAASPASAGTRACDLGWACAWKDSNFDGAKVTFEYGISDMRAFGFDDQASSLYNNGRTMNTTWYADLNYTGTPWILNRGYWVTNLSGSWLQDTITSARFI
ncbi:MAG: hypothetical protein HGA44_17300 [Cellulomonadaceae bacterium]|nr:hypothetical protein [Cellulomonadaceae bacterium]